MKSLLQEIKKCTICLPHLPHGVNPVMNASTKSRIAIIGQAPGSIVHQTGVAWNDKSGERLRDWLNVSDSTFYNPDVFAILPMGFCYPGKGKTGDLPPRPECAQQWHPLVLREMKNVELIILIGTYAQNYYLKNEVKKTLTETVKNYKEFLPKFLPLPHPSPRNNIWLKKNPWFEKSIVPELRTIIKNLI